MQMTLTAEWTQPTPTTDRIAIGGYTAVVVAVDVPNGPSAHTAYEFTVLRDHIEVVKVGQRFDRIAAQITVEEIIAEHAAGLSE